MPAKITSVQNIREVSALLTIPNSRIIAGGTAFSAEPEEERHLIDISGLEGLDGIKQKGTRIELGPLTTLSAIANSMLLKTYVPALAEAAAAADPSICERGTLGGNLASGGDCAAALLASGAKLTILTETDFREILIDRFWPSNGGNDLDYDEWITRISIPVQKGPLWGDAFGRIGEWDETQIPSAAAAVRMVIDTQGKISSVRGGIRIGAENIRRMFPLEKALKNRPLTEENTDKAIRTMITAVKSETNEQALYTLLKTLLQRAYAMAEERRAL